MLQKMVKVLGTDFAKQEDNVTRFTSATRTRLATDSQGVYCMWGICIGVQKYFYIYYYVSSQWLQQKYSFALELPKYLIQYFNLVGQIFASSRF